ncbi:hypothetical protein MKX01_025416 [Papaver californicum]|nr:hypothetical protein MKX01_025416 [Papaver californicum]
MKSSLSELVNPPTNLAMENRTMALFFMVLALVFETCFGSEQRYTSALGDPGMKRDGLRVAFEAWNFCNEVGKEAPEMGSPRAADCFDFSSSSLKHKVTEADNKLGVGNPFLGLSPKALNNTDLYAVEKELYVASLCEVKDTSNPWQFWMFKPGRFPCFGDGCMNQLLLYHQPTGFIGKDIMRVGFNGTYNLGSDIGKGIDGISFFEVVWEKNVGGKWVFKHKLKTTKKYPWLMLKYLHLQLPESPNFKVRVTLDVKKGGGPKSQFYLIDIGSCWKNNGAPCDGDVLTDVTRYSEMIINPETAAWCNPKNLINCPPFHIDPNDKKIYRNDTANFPYSAYHYYCAPGNAQYLEKPVSLCDPYSNPQAQELVQLLPHPTWANYGYPTKQGQGWVEDPKSWELDVGGLSSRLYFYQDPGTTPAKRIWTSIDMGTEIYVSNRDEMAEWTLSDFDVLLTSSPTDQSSDHVHNVTPSL